MNECINDSDIPNIELWFRGQRKDYLTPDRSSITSLNITPYSNVRDSDFTPSLYRKYDEIIETPEMYEKLILELYEWVYYADKIILESIPSETLKQIEGIAAVDSEGLLSYQRGLLLQQYGAPSAYLDITHDPDVAAWFATRKCTTNNEGKMEYSEYICESDNPDDWPTISVFPLIKGAHPYLDLSSILAGSNALRPERQKCGLLGGAGNLARNYCAKFLGMKIRLGPNFKLSTPFTPEYLFPSPSEDTVLKGLKEVDLDDKSRLFSLSELA